MSISILETINWPGADLNGKRKRTGDDRFGFDEGAGTAWVLDGATDLGPLRLFETEESDAAWIAEYLNRELMFSPPQPDEDITPYFERILTSLREKAKAASKVTIENAPKEVWPIASGMWMRERGEVIEFAWLGDCVALISPPDGPLEILTKHEQSELETRTSRELNAMSPEDKLAGLRKIRATQNSDPEHALFGLSPHAPSRLSIETRNVPEGTDIILMTDGLWRVVDPYGLMTAEDLVETVRTYSLVELMKQMRRYETEGDQDTLARIKKSDDAAAIHLQIR
ncbi:MAG: hypothetical protein CMK09_12265 [Ponticaulis sp.]|nr:hypothetical protein [Ponticaulis sp.]|tara:strand:+ start:31581 stop:32432 length:852 start_codon:yes stop_codon:yes gene_type:complete